MTYDRDEEKLLMEEVQQLNQRLYDLFQTVTEE